MAEVTGSGSIGNDKYFQYTWSGLGNGDTGIPVRFSGLADKSVQVSGTFSTGGEVTMEGSMDNTTWATLNDPQGNPITLTTGGVEAILENPRYVRPNVTGGDGSTDLTVSIGASASK